MTAVATVRELLPFWVVWGPLLFYVPAALLLSLIFAWLCTALAMGPLRRTGEIHWVERARLAHTPTFVAGWLLVFLPLSFVCCVLLAQSLTPIPRPVLLLLVFAASYLGAFVVAYFMARRLRGEKRGLLRTLRNTVLFQVILRGPVLVMALGLVFAPLTLDLQAWCLLAGVALGILFFAVGGGVLIGQALGWARPAGERLRTVADRAAARTGTVPRAVVEVDSNMANSWALSWIQYLVFTSRALEVLDDDQLEGVCVHELAHLAESRMVLLGRTLPVLLLAPFVLVVPLIQQVGMLGFLAFEMVVLVIFVLVRRFSRALERRADKAAQALETTSGTYAHALERLYQANLSPVVQPGKGTTHPHLYDRLVAAGVQPGYSRPRPPSRWRRYLCLGLGLLLAGIVAFAPVWTILLIPSEMGSHFRMALLGMSAGDLNNLGNDEWQRKDFVRSACFFAAAAEIDPGSPYYPVNEALALAAQGRCAEARRAAAEAQRRLDAQDFPGASASVRMAWQAVSECDQQTGLPAEPCQHR